LALPSIQVHILKSKHFLILKSSYLWIPNINAWIYISVILSRWNGIIHRNLWSDCLHEPRARLTFFSQFISFPCVILYELNLAIIHHCINEAVKPILWLNMWCPKLNTPFSGFRLLLVKTGRKTNNVALKCLCVLRRRNLLHVLKTFVIWEAIEVTHSWFSFKNDGFDINHLFNGSGSVRFKWEPANIQKWLFRLHLY
jgi:hypothetical protein